MTITLMVTCIGILLPSALKGASSGLRLRGRIYPNAEFRVRVPQKISLRSPATHSGGAEIYDIAWLTFSNNSSTGYLISVSSANDGNLVSESGERIGYKLFFDSKSVLLSGESSVHHLMPAQEIPVHQSHELVARVSQPLKDRALQVRDTLKLSITAF